MSLKELQDIGMKETSVTKFSYEMPIQKVKSAAFSGNELIAQVNIEDAQEIEDGTFSGCKNLQQLTLPGIPSYTSELFGGDDLSKKPLSLTSITFKEGTTEIGLILSGLSRLQYIKVPSSLTAFDEGALDGCTNLQVIDTSGPVKYANNQFKDLYRLESLSIDFPLNNGNIGLSGISRNSQLSIHVTDYNEQLKSSLLSKSQCSSIVFWNDPDTSITSMQEGAFRDSEWLREVDLSQQDWLNEIPSYAFSGCGSLTAVNLPGAIKSLKSNCFESCNIINFQLPSQLTSLDNIGMSLEGIHVPIGLVQIGPSALMDAKVIDEDVHLNDVVSIGEYAFSQSTVSSVSFGPGAAQIPSHAFFQCASLSSFDFTYVTTVKESSFQSTSLTSSSSSNLDLSRVSKVEKLAFASIREDLHVKMSPSIVEPGNFALNVFKDSQLKTVDMSDVTNKEFNKLSSLAGVSLIPESKYADDVIVVYNRVKQMFGCSTDFILILKDITIDSQGELAEYACLKYSDPDTKTILLTCDTNEQGDYEDFIQNPILPSRVLMISPNAFANQTALTSIDIKNVFLINQSAFKDCSNLQSITASQVQTVGDLAFSGCSKLASVNLPIATSIGESSFAECASLHEALVPKAQTISRFAFSNCQQLESLSMRSVQSLGEKAFANCVSLQEVTLPASLQKDPSGEQNFYSCDQLKKVIIEGSPLQVPNGLVKDVPSSLSVMMSGVSMSDSYDDLKANRLSTRPGTAFYTSDKKSMHPSLITKDSSTVIQIANGLVVDPTTLKVVKADNTYAMWYVYESDLHDLMGLADHAFNDSGVQIIQLPVAWSASQWSCVGAGIFNDGKVLYASVAKNYDDSNDAVLYGKLFSDINRGDSAPYIKFNNGRLVSATKFEYDSDPFIWDSSNTIIVGVNDSNISAFQAATVSANAFGISADAFTSSKSLKLLNIADRSGSPGELTVMNDAFRNAYTVETVTFESAENIKLSENSFRNSCIKSIKMPGLLSVDGYGLQESYKLRHLVYSEGTLQVNASAMMNCKPLLSAVEFDQDLTSIGDYAFAETDDPFPNIENIDFSNLTSLKRIGDYAFYNSIQSAPENTLKFPSSIKTINAASFAYRTGYSDYHKISALDLQNSSIETIGPSAFMNNAFKRVKLGDSLTAIAPYAFARSTYKYDIDIPASVLSIGYFAFRNNVILNPDNLKYNVISAHTTLDALSSIIGLNNDDSGLSIDENFQALNTLGLSRNTVLSALSSDYLSGFIIVTAPDENPRQTICNFCPPNMKIDILKKKLLKVDKDSVDERVYIPFYLTDTSPSAFMDCSNMKKLRDINNSKVVYFNNAYDYEFCNCTQLDNIKLLSTATNIGVKAFYNCKSISSIYGEVDSDALSYYKLSSIGSFAFAGCDNLEVFDMCSSVIAIGDCPFDDCPRLKNINVDMTVDQFFYKFKTLDEYNIKRTINRIFGGICQGAGCRINFRDSVYTNDGNIKLDPEFVRLRQYGQPRDLSAISGLVFDGPSGEDIRKQPYINLSSVSMIDPFVFDGIDTIRNVNLLPNEDTGVYLNTIGEYAFYNCSNLNSVNGCKLSCSDVGDYAFGKCTLLLNMQFDLAKLNRIGTGAFYKTNLNTLTFTDEGETNIDISRNKVIRAINFNEVGNRNPLELPEGCMVIMKLSNDVTYQFNYLLDDLSSSVIDINRHAVVFTDKTTSSVKPLVLVEATQLTSIPAIVANTYHANIIGRWK